MLQHGYGTTAPEAAALHVAQHRRFSEEVVALRAAARLGERGSKAALLSFLEAWLVNHILTTDKSLGLFLCSTAAMPHHGDMR